MAGWNGAGVFTRVYSWVADAAAGIDISASRIDSDTNNITSNGLGNCLTRDGQGTATANLPMNGFRHTGVGNGVNPTDYVALGQMQNTLTAFAVGIRFANLGDVKPTALPEGFLPTLAPGWYACSGATRPRTDPLFQALGPGNWSYGLGDGTTTYNLPDFRGRVPIGKDNMGGSNASRVTNGGSGIDATQLGSVGGNQSMQQHSHAVNDAGHTHTVTDPGHTHTVTDPGHTHNNIVTASPGGSVALALNTSATQGPGNPTVSATTGVSNQSNTTGVTNQNNTTGVTNALTGLGSSQNMPPGIVLNYIIFCGA